MIRIHMHPRDYAGRVFTERRRRTAGTWPASQALLFEGTSVTTAGSTEGDSADPEADPPLRDSQTVNPAKSPRASAAVRPGTGDPAASLTQHGESVATGSTGRKKDAELVRLWKSTGLPTASHSLTVRVFRRNFFVEIGLAALSGLTAMCAPPPPSLDPTSPRFLLVTLASAGGQSPTSTVPHPLTCPSPPWSAAERCSDRTARRP